MEYHIRVKTVVGAETAESQYRRIASFESKTDRNICHVALMDYWDGAEFDVEDD